MTGETPTSPARPIEVELKFRARNTAAAERYLAADEIAGFVPASATRTTQLEDRYLDTADGALARAGFAARLRQSAAGTVVSVKSTARRPSGKGAHRREELEGPADRTLGPRDWPSSDARSLILELCGDAPLVELVTIRQLRRKRELRHDRTHVELSVDEVDVVIRSRIVDRFVELEVELVRGDEAALDAIRENLLADPALADAAGSKLETAIAAVRAVARRPGSRASRSEDRTDASRRPKAGATATGPRPAAGPSSGAEAPPPAGTPAFGATAAVGEIPPLVVGTTPGVLADDHVAEAGRKVLRFHLARMLAREEGVRDGLAAEPVHKMRVATRRMRAAWRVFGDAFRPDRTRRYRRRLREVAGRLGAVRDLDVLLEAGETYRADLAPDERRALEPLFDGWRRYREDARILLVRELDSPGYARFTEAFRVFVQTEGAAVLPVGPTQPHRIRDTAPARIWAAYQQVRAYEQVLRWADVETLHELRIAAKRFRYTLEFIREALSPDVDALVARIVVLQDHLGEMNDAEVSGSMARTFLVEHGDMLTAAESTSIEQFVASREAEVARLRKSIGGPWRGVSSVSFRRSLGRVVAEL